MFSDMRGKTSEALKFCGFPLKTLKHLRDIFTWNVNKEIIDDHDMTALYNMKMDR